VTPFSAHRDALNHSFQTIENVEQEVERLLDEDSLASEVKYGERSIVNG